MRWLVITIFLLLGASQDYEYKWGRPTSKGVDKYVEYNEYQFVIDYQNFIGDTLTFEPFISTEDLTKYYNYVGGDAGYFERPDNILINNKSQYIDYELQRLSEFRKSQYREASMFVRAVVMHELTHCYIYQIMMMAQYEKNLALEFRQGLRIIPLDNYGSDFVIEGICEAVVAMMDEMIVWDEPIKITKFDLSTSRRHGYETKYRYSQQYMKPVIEEFGLEAAIYMVVSNKPPSDEEILNPKLYYDRLKWN